MKYEERLITVNGSTAVCHAYPRLGAVEETIDHSASLDIVQKELKRLQESGLPQVIAIVGPSGSGKTVLANVLAENSKNVELINCFAKISNLNEFYKIPLSSCRVGKTYIIDEVHYCDKLSLNDWLQKLMTKRGCVAILFVQCIDEFDLSIPFSEFTLSRSGLSIGNARV